MGHNENGFVSGISQPQKGQVMYRQFPHPVKNPGFSKGHRWRTLTNVTWNSNETVCDFEQDVSIFT